MNSLNVTKKMFFVMVITAIILPASMVMGLMVMMDTGEYEGPRQIKLDLLLKQLENNEISQEEFIEDTKRVKSIPAYGGPNPGFYITIITTASIVFWVGYAIRQWIVLSRWSKRYLQVREEKKEKHYKKQKDTSSTTMSHTEYSHNKEPIGMFFDVVDNAIHSLDNTKKTFIIIAIVAIVVQPLTMLAIVSTGALNEMQVIGDSQRKLLEQFENNKISQEKFIKETRDIGSPYGAPSDALKTGIYVHLVVITIASVLTAYGILQWFRFAKWNKNYQEFKSRDDEINKKLGKEFKDI